MNSELIFINPNMNSGIGKLNKVFNWDRLEQIINKCYC